MGSANLIVVNATETDTFLRAGRLAKLKKLLEPCRVVDADCFSEEQWEALLIDADPQVIVGGWAMKPLPRNALSELAPSFRYLCYLAGSVRHRIPRDLIEEGLLVTNWGASISRTISECALLLILSCMRRSSYWSHQMHELGNWKNEDSETMSLFGRRVGLHGFGAIAKALVPLLRPFTHKISSYTDGMPDEVYREYGVKKAKSLKELFSENDVVVEVEALTPDRVGIVGESLLRSIPEGGVFVNVARGALVDEEALLRVVLSSNLQVGLDVYSVEPLASDSPIRSCRNVNLLPHLSGPTTDRRCDAADFALSNIKKYLNGDPVDAVVSCDVYDRST